MDPQMIEFYRNMPPELPILSFSQLLDDDAEVRAFREQAQAELKAYEKEYFNATLATDKLAKDRNLRLDPDSTLPKIATDAAEGRTVQVNHATYGESGIPLGKTITGNFDKSTGRVNSKIYLDKDERGTHIARKIIGGTMTDGSPGLDTAGSHIECDFCGQHIKYGWFSFGDKNGHYPGKKIYVDADGNETTDLSKAKRTVMITGNWKNAGLREFSVAYKGALPDVKIMKQAFSQGLLTTGQVDYLEHAYGADFMQQLSTQSFSIPNPNRRTPMSTPNDLQTVIDELRDTNATLTAEKTALETQVSELTEKADAYDENLQNLTEAQAEVERLKGEINEYEVLQTKAAQVDRCIEVFQDIVIQERRRAKGVGENEEAQTAAEDRIKEMRSADALYEMYQDFKNNTEERYTARKSVVSTGTKSKQQSTDYDKAYRQGAYQ